MSSPAQKKIAFIGDDFTGSIDTMETLNSRGVSTVLFLKAPDDEILARFSQPDAIGVATSMRSMSPDQIDGFLPRLLRDLSKFGAEILHYKVCSTFDSSPHFGSIGRVLDIYKSLYGSAKSFVLLGQPNLARYGVFGTLFARLGSDGPIYRIDRHPSMSRHPITPMAEADILRHLSEQTEQLIALLNYVELEKIAGSDHENESYLADVDADVLVIDVASENGVTDAGRVLQKAASSSSPIFVVGPSTVAQALCNVRLPEATTQKRQPAPQRKLLACEDQNLLVISGSCSPVTAQQIGHAVAEGFHEIALDPADFLTSTDAALSDDLLMTVSEKLKIGQSVIIHTCSGPDDPRRENVTRLFMTEHTDREGASIQAGIAVAKAVQRLVLTLMKEHGLRRLCLAGGDFSSVVVQGLGIDALTIKCPIGPGVSLCTAHSKDVLIDQLEIALKGGQMGGLSYFSDLRAFCSSNG